jgi:two-component system sensor histidine kinase KdpD
MKLFLRAAFRAVLGIVLTVSTATICYHFHVNRAMSVMALVLEVLAIATQGNWVLALLTSTAASLAFSWYFVESVGSLRIKSAEGAATFSMMVLTALTASHLAVRAQRRAAEAIRRREEMERLHQFGRVLLAADTIAEAAGKIVENVVELFGVSGAVLRIDETPGFFQAGDRIEGDSCVIQLHPGSNNNVLELHGVQPSAEVQSALASLVSLVLDRARAAEERARAEATQRGEELRTTVLNALAHDFRTPLTSIKAAASMLRGSGELPASDRRELVAVIDEEADRLDQLIRESLALARIEAHRENPRLEQCALSEIVALATARVERYLGGRELTVDLPEDLPPVWGDKFLLEQMLIQVVDNAWKYSKPGAHIRIHASLDVGNVILTVQNEGSQIPRDERDRIFAKFYRGTANRARVEGTGLGLAIARTIAEAHGGALWLDEEMGGPAFRFMLPVEVTGKFSDRESHYIAH